MNDWDRDNLDFIMGIDAEAFDDWLQQADDDDIQYALELIRMARAELMVEEFEIKDEVEDTAVAKAILERIKNASKNR
jgi:hypothetical protein